MCTKSRKTGVILVVLLDLVLQGYFRYIGFGVANRGVSFGLGQEWGNVLAVLVFILLIGVIANLVLKLKQSPPVGDCRVTSFLAMTKRNDGVFLIILGGLGNILSRLVWGSVWDYICVLFLPFCFNLSDALISLGVVSYILRGNGNRSTLRGQRNTGNQ